jgi:lysophospholipase L1-like esterase
MLRLSPARKLAFTAMVSAGLWLLAEAVATRLYAPELLAWSSPPPSPERGLSVLQGNPYLLYEYPPGTHHERGVVVTINSLGLRGPEIERPKPDGIRRFLTTGDSSIFGFGVADDQVFSSVAAKALGEGVEPVVGATPGYSTFETLNLLHMRALSTEPDLLVICNLWSDNNFDSFVDKEVLEAYAGYSESLGGRVKDLFAHSAIYRVMDWRLRVKKTAHKVQKTGWMLDSGGHDGRRRVEINDYASNLDRIARMGIDTGAELVFVIPPNNEDLPSETDTGQPKAWTPYRKVMRDTADRYGAPIIDGPALFLASGKTKGELFLDEMHPTAVGHALLGQELARLLQEKGWPAGGSVLGEPAGGGVETYEDPFLQGTSAEGGPGGNAAVGPPSGSGGGSPAGGDPGPNPNASPQPNANAPVRGTVVASGYTQGRILIDAVTPGSTSPTVLANTALSGPGPFSLNTGAAKECALRAYFDEDSDGPDADDKLFDLTATVLDLSDGPVIDITLDLDEGTVELP